MRSVWVWVAVIDILRLIMEDVSNNTLQAIGRKAEPNTGGLLLAGLPLIWRARFVYLSCAQGLEVGRRRVNFDKQPTTIEEQADLLAKRGLLVTDRGRLLRELRTIGYYRLSAYWLYFEVKPMTGQTRSKRFVPGTRHEDVVDLYIFDRKLRLMIMEAIERVEVALRASWTNRLSLAHGAHAHLDPSFFKDPGAHVLMLAKLEHAVARSTEAFVSHYRKKYCAPSMPPLWAVTEMMTLGELSKWYAMTMSNIVRGQVARDLGLPNKEIVEGVIQVLAHVRNLCAHHARLWNRRFVKRLPNIKRYRGDIITEAKDPRKASNLIYNVLVVCMRLLRAQSPQTSYPGRLTELIETVGEDRRDAMGFPRDWRTRPAWTQN